MAGRERKNPISPDYHWNPFNTQRGKLLLQNFGEIHLKQGSKMIERQCHLVKTSKCITPFRCLVVDKYF